MLRAHACAEAVVARGADARSAGGRRARAVLALLVAILALAIPHAVAARGSSVVTSAWLAPVAVSYEQDEELAAFPYNRPECLDPNSKCFVATGYGISSGDTIRLAGYGPYVPIASPWSVPIPQSKVLLWLGGGFSGSDYLFLRHDFVSSMVTSLLADGTLGGLRIGKSPEVKSPMMARDDTIAFAQNGKWMVFDAGGIGMVRVNLETFEFFKFGLPREYDLGYDPGLRFAISDDGRYVAAHGATGTTSLEVYDLDNCVPPQPGTVVAHSLVTGYQCQSRSLESQLQTTLPGYIGAWPRIFIGDSTLVLNVAWKPGAAVQRARYIVTAGGSAPTKLDYLALGDSYSSGEGAYSYVAGTDTATNNCHQSLVSYPYRVAATIGITSSARSVACSGAHTYDITTGHQHAGNGDAALTSFLPGVVPQLDFVRVYRPNRVTVGIGGNDVGFAEIVKKCVIPGPDCYDTPAERRGLIDRMRSKFDDLVIAFEKIKNTNAEAGRRVYVLAYPQVAVPSAEASCAVNVRLSPGERNFAARLVSDLNMVIKRAAERAGVFYADTEHALDHHRMCEGASDVAVNGVTVGNDIAPLADHGIFLKVIGNESFHPNKRGNELLASALLAATNNLSASMPASNPNAVAPLVSSFSILLDATSAITPTQYQVMGPQIATLQSPYPVNLQAGSVTLQAGGTYTLTGHSDPVTLGTATADASGNLSTTITWPSSLTAGFHELHVTGPDLAGKPIDMVQDVFVAASASDVDGNGVPDELQPCLFYDPAGVDADGDGIDDACDAAITTRPIAIAAAAAVPHAPFEVVLDGTASTATDAEILSYEWVFDDDVIGTGGTVQHTFATRGTHTATLQVTDTAGATGRTTVTFEIAGDTTPPTLTLPEPVTAEATSTAGTGVTYTASASDDVDGTVTPSCVPASGDRFALGTTTVRCSAVDAAGNTATGSFTVTVRDKTPPVLNLPTPITANATSALGAAVPFSAVAVDAVDGPLSVTCTNAVGEAFVLFAIGRTIVYCSAVDTRGNIASGDFTITVQMTTRPVTPLPTDRLTVEWKDTNRAPFEGLASAVTMSSDGVMQSQLPLGAPLSWSPDGSRAVVNLPWPSYTNPWNLFVTNADGSDPHPLTTTGIRFPSQALWSPRGDKILWDSTIADTDGSNERTIDGRNLSFTPDGNRVVYASNSDSPPCLRTQNVEGDNDRAIICRTGLTYPAMSRDSERVSYIAQYVPPGATRFRTGIFIANVDGIGAPRLIHETNTTVAGGIAAAPMTWSPDGHYLLVLVQDIDTKRPDLSLLATDGSGLWQIPNPQHDYRYSGVWDTPNAIDATPPTTLDDAPIGWVNSATTVHLTAADAGSGVTSTWFSVDGAASQQGTTVSIAALADHSNDGVHTIAYFSKDKARNVEQIRTALVRVDTRAPSVVPTPDGTLNAAGWYAADVPVRVDGDDEASGVTIVHLSVDGIGSTTIGTSATATVATEGVNDVTFSATDAAGNVSAVQTLVVRLDKTAPQLLFDAVDTETWHRTELSVPFEVSDTMSGVYATSSPSPLVLSAEGAAVTADVTVADVAGNTRTYTTPAFKIDKTAPTIAFEAPEPSANASRWNRTTVTVGFTAADAVSGLDDGTASPLVFASEGQGQTQTVTVRDRAGNVATAESSAISIDETAPSVSFGALTPAPNAATWNNSDVSVPFAVGDELSGIDSNTPSPLIFTNEGRDETQTVVAVDRAGNAARVGSPRVNIDKTAPSVAFVDASPAANAHGWNNSPVTLPFTTADGLSGLASTSEASPLAFDSEGSGQTRDVTVADVAGNSAVYTSPRVSIDERGPVVIFGIPTPTANGAGWNNTSVTVPVTANDALSGVIEAPASLVVLGHEGEDVSADVFAADRAGNATTAMSPHVKIDLTPPTLSFGAASPSANAFGWNNSYVAFAYDSADALSGVVATTPASPAVVRGEGRELTTSVTVADAADNTATFSTPPVSIDRTKPTVTFGAPSPPANSDGWNITDVAFPFTTNDDVDGAGLYQTNPVSPVVVVGEGLERRAMVNSTDLAGNTVTAATPPANIDRAAPTVSCGAADPVWHAVDVLIGCTATDALSGLVTVDGAFTLSTSVASGAFDTNAATGSRAVCDHAGLCTTAGPVGGSKVDRAAPKIAIDAPAATTYTVGNAVTAAYGCADGGSGLSTCAGAVAAGTRVDTTSVGAHMFRVDASDAVANTSSATVAYDVTYGVCVVRDLTKPKNGNVKVEFTLCDSAGTDLAVASPLAVVATALDGVGIAPAADVAFDKTLGTSGGYRYDVSAKPLAAGTHTLSVNVAGDPAGHTITFATK
jgi:hypothetical protein